MRTEYSFHSLHDTELSERETLFGQDMRGTNVLGYQSEGKGVFWQSRSIHGSKVLLSVFLPWLALQPRYKDLEKSFPPSAPVQPFSISCMWYWSYICQRLKPAQLLMANILAYLASLRPRLRPSGPATAEQHQSRSQITLLHHKMNRYQLANLLRVHLASWWCHK